MKNNGFTLLEVVIAMAILAIALTSLFGSQSASVALATETRFNVQAPLLARMQLSRLQAEENVSDDSGDFGEEFPGFQWQLRVEDLASIDSELLETLDGKLQHLILVVSFGQELFSYELESYMRSEE
ncbi:MAG: type II secretion system protein [Thermodesulfobacteriota bacterium]